MQRRQCIGSGVPDDWFEFGHWILPGTEQQVFPVKWRHAGSTYFQKRCYLCDSTRRYWQRSTDATGKATKAHRTHAEKMVKKGFAPDIETAVQMMNAADVTVPWLAETALAAFKKPCPGHCFVPVIDNGKPVCQVHVIAEWSDLTLDWHDPRFPITRENVGWLCMGCNQQKHEKPWAEFMARQHAIRQNFLNGERLPIPMRLF